jgi:hypothetical protein
MDRGEENVVFEFKGNSKGIVLNIYFQHHLPDLSQQVSSVVSSVATNQDIFRYPMSNGSFPHHYFRLFPMWFYL